MKLSGPILLILSIFGSSVVGTKEEVGDDHLLPTVKSDDILGYLTSGGSYGYDLPDADYNSHDLLDLPSMCQLLSVNGGIGKRTFHPWGGKRAVSAAEGYHQLLSNYIKKGAGFNPWGGKRQLTDSDNTGRVSGGGAILIKNRQAFNPWGGKRR